MYQSLHIHPQTSARTAIIRTHDTFKVEEPSFVFPKDEEEGDEPPLVVLEDSAGSLEPIGSTGSTGSTGYPVLSHSSMYQMVLGLGLRAMTPSLPAITVSALSLSLSPSESKGVHRQEVPGNAIPFSFSFPTLISHSGGDANEKRET